MMEPWQSWAVVLVGGGAAWYYYNTQSKSKGPGRRPEAPLTRRPEPRASQLKESSQSRRRRDGSTGSHAASGSDVPEVRYAASSNSLNESYEQPKKRKEPRAKGSRSALSSAVETVDAAKGTTALTGDADIAADEGISNKELAQQLAGLKKGTTLVPPKDTKDRVRTVKQSRSNGSNVAFGPGGNAIQDASATSSTTDADGDDDLSPAVSPSLGAAAQETTQAAAEGVSDMLEAPSAGPSVLKLTDPTEPPRQQRQREQKGPVIAETKKQRQNRKKAEEKRVAREESERERRVLLEKQLRASRQAEGRPARNGVAAQPAAAPKSSAWTSSAPASKSANVSGLTNGGSQLLDTFEPTASSGNVSSSQKENAQKTWDRDLPTEEDQVRIINELDNDAGWNTVSTKGKKGRKAVKEDSNGKAVSGQDSDSEAKPSSGGLSLAGNNFSSTGDSDWAVV